MPERRLVVIGHPLAAGENRLAFAGWRGFDVHLILPREWRSPGLRHVYRAGEAAPASEGMPGLHPLPVLGSGRNSLFLWWGLAGLLDRLRPDALYCWEEPWCLATRQTARIARARGIPFYFYTAENRPKRLPWPFTALLRATFREAAGCIAPTHEIAERIRAGGWKGPVAVVPLWVRPRQSLEPDPGTRRIAYVGRLIPLKRVHLLIEALADLPGFRLRIVGDGPEGDRLRALARERGLDGRVEFAGHTGNAELGRALEGCSLLALPTGENARQAEQFGKAAVEGVTFGLPVLASRGGNLAALADAFPTVSARTFDTPAGMAEAVREVYRVYPSRTALEAARAKAEAEFGPSAAARRLESAFSAWGTKP